jgi:hypothetical protein
METKMVPSANRQERIAFIDELEKKPRIGGASWAMWKTVMG